MTSEKGEKAQKRQRATPELPGQVMEAVNAFCEADPYIKKTKVVAAVRAQYAGWMREQVDDARSEFVKQATSDGGIKKLL